MIKNSVISKMSGKILAGALFDYSSKPKTLLNPNETYKIIKNLGTGAYGDVSLIIDLRTQQKYALKSLPDTDPISFQREIESLKILSMYPDCNDDIICYYDNFQVLDEYNEMRYCILLEYIEGRDLLELIGELTQKNILEIALWLTSVLTNIHRHGIVHLDITTSNIMITSDNQLKL